nr:uncharacterized protein LOC112770462 [Arachis hypogaea]
MEEKVQRLGERLYSRKVYYVGEGIEVVYKGVVVHMVDGKVYKYLDSMEVEGVRSKKAAFGAIKDKVRKRVEGWKRKLLSVGGRHVLIKAVGEAVPIYTLSCFKLHDSLLQKIHGILARLWWSQKGEERKISWVSWDMMTRPKVEGGLGFKNLKARNLALLGKQCWRIATQLTSLLVRILKGKYFRYTEILRAEVGNLPS